MKKIDYININKHIAKIFKEYRIKNNYTQEQVAELSNLSAKYISQLERCISGGTLEAVLKLCNVYKVSRNTILKPFLNNKILNTNNDITEKYDKLSLKDKETINILIEHLLKNRNRRNMKFNPVFIVFIILLKYQ